MFTGIVTELGTVRALDGVDLTVRPGEIVALLGPNGAGKSTAMEMMVGLARPDQGTATVISSPVNVTWPRHCSTVRPSMRAHSMGQNSTSGRSARPSRSASGPHISGATR